jgi:hypothetical protein
MQHALSPEGAARAVIAGEALLKSSELPQKENMRQASPFVTVSLQKRSLRRY